MWFDEKTKDIDPLMNLAFESMFDFPVVEDQDLVADGNR